VRSFTDATELVLRRFGNGQPMHYRAIALKALDLGVIETTSQTPEATLYAAVYQEINRDERRGDAPRFFRLDRGFFGLSEWQQTGLAYEIDRHNREVRASLRERLLSSHPTEFEALVGRLLVALGFDEVQVTGRSGDGGIDVRGTLVVGDVIRTRMAVQVKRWRNNVQAPTVQQVRGSLGTHEQGLIITTSGFSSGAQEEASRPNAVPVALMNGEQLVALLVEHDIGVRREPHYLLELLDEDEEEPA
jgi:restriction system protein